jgi:hypothetical protein
MHLANTDFVGVRRAQTVNSSVRRAQAQTFAALEEKIEAVRADVIVKLGLKKLLLLPDRHMMHRMSKVAVAV